MRICRYPIFLCALLFFSFAIFAIDIGIPPLFDNDEGLGLEKKDDEFRCLGPIFEDSSKREGVRELTAFRPVFSMENFGGLYSFDILWPFFVYRENNFEKYWRFFLLYSGRSKLESQGVEAEKPHTGFVPLWLYGWDAGGEFYWAFFPFYGEARDFIGYDSIYYVMFPIYLRTRKGQINGEAYFWPILNWDESPSFRKFRFFPFYAYHDRPTSFRRASYLWPFYHSAEYYSAKEGGRGWMLWPFYGENRFKDLDSWTVLWPFFSVYRREKTNEGEEDGFGMNMPWPFIQYRRNVDRNEKNEKWRFYLWPLIGRSEKKDSKYQFVLWPFISSSYTSGEQGDVDWVWVLPFYWSKHAKDHKGDNRERYRNFYPFVSYLDKGEISEVRILDLWFQRNMPAVERNWAPLWTLFSYQSKAETFRYDFLWGLVKYFKNLEDGEGFAIQPFYRCVSVSENAGYEDKRADGGSVFCDAENLSSSKKRRVQRDYFLGLLRTYTDKDGRTFIKLFWSFEFEF